MINHLSIAVKIGKRTDIPEHLVIELDHMANLEGSSRKLIL